MNHAFLTSDNLEDRTVSSRERAHNFPSLRAQLRVQTAVVLSTTFTRGYFMAQTLLEMARALVLAQVEAHRLSPEEMHKDLQQTYASLQALKAQEDVNGTVAVVTPETPSNPVNWRKSITKHMVMCPERRASFKQLSVRHLKEHGLDGKAYRTKYGIPRTQSLAAKE